MKFLRYKPNGDLLVVVATERIRMRVLVRQVLDAHNLLEPVVLCLHPESPSILHPKPMRPESTATYHCVDVVRAHDENARVCSVSG